MAYKGYKGCGPRKLGTSPFKQNHSGKKSVSEVKQNPTRNDSVVSAYHNRHVANKTPSYTDPYYNKSRAKAAKVKEKYPSLDAYMQTEAGRASVGQGGK